MCGWPASLQSPATPEEVDGIRRLGGQQESVRHERDNDNCELKVIHLKLKFRVRAGAHSDERLLFQDLVRHGACVVGPKDIDHNDTEMDQCSTYMSVSTHAHAQITGRCKAKT